MVKKSSKEISVENYSHEDKKRKNNPPVGLVSSTTDKINGKIKYQHDPHIDPYLSWAGKAERTSFEVYNVSLHIHERIDPKRIIKAFLKKETRPRQISLFEHPENDPPLNIAIDFYRHEHDWTNRLIAGDSLLVMNSLLNKEGMAGKVQMVYIDPPYGIKYNSNFQPFINRRDVKDGNDADIPAEPEMIQAFRDTWELGIHSYLTYLRNRLLLAKELLSDSGSCFVQISDENVHFVRNIMEEIFDKKNFCGQIAFQKSGKSYDTAIPSVTNYIIWYSKDIRDLKIRRLFREKTEIQKLINDYNLIDDNGKRYRLSPINSQDYSATRTKTIIYNGKEYHPGKNRHWSIDPNKIPDLLDKGILTIKGNSIFFKLYLEDQPGVALNNLWDDTSRGSFGDTNIYVVQTTAKTIERCILMTTDPGDLILDPTCGSGTTAYAAEKWGRRWITCDTSHVAIALAKQRLMTAKFDYYDLAHSDEGIRSGFRYKTVPHITLQSIANNEPAKEEILYDQPHIDKDKVRVTGPFTVEAVPSLRIKPLEIYEHKIDSISNQLSRIGDSSNLSQWLDELKSAGIRIIGGKQLTFSMVEPMIATHFIHAKGEILGENDEIKLAYMSFGPDFGPLEQRQVEETINEARSLKEKPDFIIFAAFHFDPEAAKDIDEINWPGVIILKSQMSVDLLTSDLRKKRSSNQSYWLIGQPDIEVTKQDNRYKVKVNGFDYYDPISGEIVSKDSKHIAMWFLDTDYDERSLFPDQVFFPMGDSDRDWTKLAKVLKSSVDEDLLEKFVGTESLPFEAGENNKIAVKIVDIRGIESFVVKSLD